MTVNQRVSPTLIGAFVLGAVVLAVMAVVLIGSGRFFRRTSPFVLYFSGSVNGLRLGAPVKFRGVEIGSVEDIRIRLQPDQGVPQIPVTIGIDPEKITSLGASETILDSPEEYQSAIDAGLRGQLQTESFVTGVLFVALDYFPGSPATFVDQPRSRKFQYREIPTEPSSTEKARMALTQVLTHLAESDLKGLVDSARLAISELHQLVGSPDLKVAVRSLDDLTGRLGDAAGSVSLLAAGLDSNVSGLTEDLRQTSVNATAMIDQARKVLQHTDTTLNESSLVYELTRTLQEVSAAARSVRLLTGYLERNPSVLLFGRPVVRGEVMRGPSARPMLLGLACLGFTACVHVGQQQEHPWRLFTLSPLPGASQAEFTGSPGPAQPVIGVGPIHLPGYLDQDQIVTRISQNRFALSDNDRWAGPLADNLAQVLAQNLSTILQTQQIILHPWTGQQRPTYQLEIDVLRFEMDTTGTAHLVARYFLRDVASRQTIAGKEACLTTLATGSSTEQSVASLSKVLADFSVEIAKVIREFLAREATLSRYPAMKHGRS